MAAAISVRNMLQRMGLSVEAATEVVNVNGQNLSVLDDFLQLEDKDVETLCRVISLEGSTQPETRIRGCRFRLWHSGISPLFFPAISMYVVLF